MKARDYSPALYEGNKILPSDILGGGGLGIGNVYYVIDENASFYSDFQRDHNVIYSDGSKSVYPCTMATAHTAIQAALDACVSGRNDYVLIMPSITKYTVTSTLTMSKNNVHLICPAGMGMNVGADNSARIQQTTANTPIITLNGRNCEIAGLFLINAPSTSAGGSAIYASEGYSATYDSGGAGYCYIHHNYFAVWLSGATNSALISGVINSWTRSRIERNVFEGYAEDASCTIASVIYLYPSATGCRVDHNEFTVGDGATWTAAVTNMAVKGSVSFNVFHESQGSTPGIFTNAIVANVGAEGASGGTAIIGNRGAVISGHLLSGGASGKNFCDNLDATATSGTDHWNLES